MKKLIIKIIPFVLTLSSNYILASAIDDGIVGLIEVADVYKNTEGAKKEGKLNGVVVQSAGQVGKIMGNHGDKLVAKSAEFLSKSKEYGKLTKRANDLANKYKSFVGNVKANKVGKLAENFSKKSVEMQKLAGKANVTGKLLKAAGAGIGAATSVYSFSKKMNEYDKKRRSGNTSLVDHMTIGKDALVSVTSNVPVAGTLVVGLDMTVDFAADQVDSQLDHLRTVSLNLANRIQTVRNFGNDLLRVMIKKGAKDGIALSRETLKKMRVILGEKMQKKIEGFASEVKATNSIFDGDVGVSAYQHAIEYAKKLQQTDVNDPWVVSMEEMSAKMALDGLLVKLNTTGQELLGISKELEQVVDNISKIDRVVSKIVVINKNSNHPDYKKSAENAQVSKINKNIAKASELKEENKKLAEALSKDPTNEGLKKKLDENGEAFAEIRAEIQKDDPDYNVKYDNSYTVLKRLGNNKSGKGKNKEKIAKKNKDRKEKLDEINKQAKVTNKAKTAQSKNELIKLEISSLEIRKRNAEADFASLLAQNSGGSSSTKTKYNKKKFGYLMKAKKLVAKYGDTSLNQWNKNDRVKLGILAKNLGIGYGSGIIGKATYLRTQLRRGQFSYLRDKYVAITIRSTYKGVDNSARIKELGKEIEKLNKSIYANQQNLLTSSELFTLSENIKKSQKFLEILLDQHAVILSDMNKLSDEFNDGVKFVASTAAEKFVSNTTGETFVVKEWFGSHSFLDVGIGGQYSGDFDHADTYPEGTVAIVSGKSVSMDLSTLRDRVKTGKGDHFGNYSYTAWGEWFGTNYIETNPGTQVSHGYWVIGAGNKNEIPQQGLAIYNGELKGDMRINTQTYNDAIRGNISIEANFSSRQVSGSMAVICNDSSCATGQFNNLPLSGAEWNGQMNVVNGNGYINGAFYGPQAAETGGVFLINKLPNTAIIGVFRAKQ